MVNGVLKIIKGVVLMKAFAIQNQLLFNAMVKSLKNIHVVRNVRPFILIKMVNGVLRIIACVLLNILVFNKTFLKLIKG